MPVLRRLLVPLGFLLVFVGAPFALLSGLADEPSVVVVSSAAPR